VLLISIGPTKLSETSEWRAFEKVLSAKKSWAMVVMPKQEHGKAFSFAGTPDGFRFASTGATEYCCDGKTGFALNTSAKTWRKIKSLNDFEPFFKNGKPFIFSDLEGEMSRLTLADSEGHQSLLGWRAKFTGRDDVWESAVWFDAKTHLISEYELFGFGMVWLPGYEGSYRVFWDFSKPDYVRWSTTPPAGYREVKSR
jgi:hypothetical protein